jgi:hypothetical protein
VLLRLPVVGRLTRGLNTARLASTLAILVGSRVPLLSALKAGVGVVGNLPMKRALEETQRMVREGAPLSRALASQKMFPPMMVHLISSGEASGRLDQMLERAATSQTREVEGRIATLTSLLEPLLILAMGVLVLLIVLAILLPIFELNTLVNNPASADTAGAIGDPTSMNQSMRRSLFALLLAVFAMAALCARAEGEKILSRSFAVKRVPAVEMTNQLIVRFKDESDTGRRTVMSSDRARALSDRAGLRIRMARCRLERRWSNCLRPRDDDVRKIRRASPAIPTWLTRSPINAGIRTLCRRVIRRIVFWTRTAFKRGNGTCSRPQGASTHRRRGLSPSVLPR